MAVRWAAREAGMRTVPLSIIHIIDTPPSGLLALGGAALPESTEAGDWQKTEGANIISAAIKVAEDSAESGVHLKLFSEVYFAATLPALIDLSKQDRERVQQRPVVTGRAQRSGCQQFLERSDVATWQGAGEPGLRSGVEGLGNGCDALPVGLLPLSGGHDAGNDGDHRQHGQRSDRRTAQATESPLIPQIGACRQVGVVAKDSQRPQLSHPTTDVVQPLLNAGDHRPVAVGVGQKRVVVQCGVVLDRLRGPRCVRHSGHPSVGLRATWAYSGSRADLLFVNATIRPGSGSATANFATV
jgi:hypothetical protein